MLVSSLTLLMVYQSGWWPFDVKAFKGYTPRRNATDDYFKVETPVTFCFEVIPPTECQVPEWRKRIKGTTRVEQLFLRSGRILAAM